MKLAHGDVVLLPDAANPTHARLTILVESNLSGKGFGPYWCTLMLTCAVALSNTSTPLTPTTTRPLFLA